MGHLLIAITVAISTVISYLFNRKLEEKHNDNKELLIRIEAQSNGVLSNLKNQVAVLEKEISELKEANKCILEVNNCPIENCPIKVKEND